MNLSLKLSFVHASMFPRKLISGGMLIPKFAHLSKPCWVMVHGATSNSIDENFEKLKKLAKRNVFNPYEATFNTQSVSNEEAAEILEHLKLRKFTKVMHTETDIA